MMVHLSSSCNNKKLSDVRIVTCVLCLKDKLFGLYISDNLLSLGAIQFFPGNLTHTHPLLLRYVTLNGPLPAGCQSQLSLEIYNLLLIH